MSTAQPYTTGKEVLHPQNLGPKVRLIYCLPTVSRPLNRSWDAGCRCWDIVFHSSLCKSKQTFNLLASYCTVHTMTMWIKVDGVQVGSGGGWGVAGLFKPNFKQLQKEGVLIINWHQGHVFIKSDQIQYKISKKACNSRREWPRVSSVSSFCSWFVCFKS